MLDPEDGVDEVMAPSVRNADAFLPSASQIHPLTFAKNLPNQFGILKTSLDAHKVISARYCVNFAFTVKTQGFEFVKTLLFAHMA